MQIIYETATGLVLYAGETLTLTKSGASNSNWLDAHNTTDNCTLVDDVELPAGWSGGLYIYVDGEWALTDDGAAVEAAKLTADRAALVRQIDADTDALYGAVIGNRSAEYTLAEVEAAAYVADAYTTDPVPSSVAVWATAKGWTAQQAADDIITTATAWRTAQAAIRAARLLRKEQARNAADQAALAVVRAQWAGFMAAVRQQLGGV